MGAKHAGPVDHLIANRVRLERIQRGMSQSELAGNLGVTFQQIQKYEKGLNRIGAGRLYEIAQFFNLPIQLFYPGEATIGDEIKATSAGPEDLYSIFRSPEGQQLCRAFLSIKNPNVRRKLVALLQELAKSGLQQRADN